MDNQVPDAPKSLHDPQVKQARMDLVREPHVAELTGFVNDLREKTGLAGHIPYFDPLDGGIMAPCLFLFEAQGRKAVESGFISRNNPDETAKNFFQVNEEAGLPRRLTASWNIVPWYLGSDKRIRSATCGDIVQGIRHLHLFRFLKVIVLCGRKAQTATGFIKQDYPSIRVLEMYHPSPNFVNRAPDNRRKIRQVLRKVARSIP